MGKPATPKQRVSQALKFLKAFNRYNERKARRSKLSNKNGPSDHDADIPPNVTVEKILQQLEKPLSSLFKKADLDIENEDHWEQLLIFIAWAIYCKPPGRELEWDKPRLRQLLTDVNDLRAGATRRTELACCKILAKDEKYIKVG